MFLKIGEVVEKEDRAEVEEAILVLAVVCRKTVDEMW